MSQAAERPKEGDLPPVFIEGYFTDLVKAGKRPTYGYPSNHLPDTTRPSMSVVTSFLAQRTAA